MSTALIGTEATPIPIYKPGAAQGFTLAAMATLPTLAIAGLVPVLPALFEQFHDVPHAQWLIPMVLTMPSLCVASLSSVIGAAADRWGRRRVLLPALCVFAIFGLAPLLAKELTTIIATRCAVGISEAAILTVGNALMGDYFDPEARKRWLALQTIIGPFAVCLYVLLGGALGSWNWRGPFILYLTGLLVWVPAVLFLHETRPATERASPAKSLFPWGPTLLVSSVTLLLSVIFFVQNVQHGRIFSDLGARSPALISWIITAAGFGTVLAGFAYRYMRALPVSNMLALIFLIYGIGYAGLSRVSNYLSAIPFDALGQFAGGLTIPVLVSWTLTKYDFAHRGRGMGIWAACFFLGQFLSPPLVTLVGHDQWTFLESVGFLGMACFVLAAIAWLLGKTSKRSVRI